MIGKQKALLFSILLYLPGIICSQVPAYNFRQLTTTNGLSDGIVRAIVQDKYGFIWIGTSYGLNRFDGINVKSFFSKRGDTNSLANNYIQSLYCDAKGNLWIGTLTTLCRYDYTTARFINYASEKDVAVFHIRQDKKGNTWLGTDNGLWLVDEQKLFIRKFKMNNDTVFEKKFQYPVTQIVVSRSGDWYLATSHGIKIFNPQTYKYDEINHDTSNNFSISSNNVFSLAFDAKGYLWAACRNPKSILNKIDLHDHTVKLYDHFITPRKKLGNNDINNILIDKNGRLWATSSQLGLSLYDEKTDGFHDYKNDPFLFNSIIADHNLTLYQDGNGTIWVGSIRGVSYFNPDKTLFYSIHSSIDKNNSLPGDWCRVACEDDQNNLWLGTGNGLAKYDRLKRSFTVFANEGDEKTVLHLNSIRSLVKDDMGDLWIGTAKGLNRYHPSTGIMDFFDERHGMPLSFFWMLAKDKNGEVWLGSTSGLYHYLRKENYFDDLAKDSLLSKYAHKNIQALFVDSRNRLWFGILNVGVIMYDQSQRRIVHLTIKDSLLSDTRASSFAEDKNGIIWIGSENGITAYDPAKNRSRFFTRENGLPSNRANNLMVDRMNRLWFGTSNGLCVLSADRSTLKRFDVNDGLLTNQFNEQSAYRTHDGLFIFPTYNGFLVFSPENYRGTRDSIPVYITSFKVSDKELNTGYNTEAIRDVRLRHDQNFFSIGLAGLNYMNPHECTYAYKLDPFDKNWIYTDKREINYTNVPAGSYVFRYKVFADNLNPHQSEKTMNISVAAVFYKTWWFQLLMMASAIVLLYEIYIYRIRNKQNILLLQNKAQLLEKEKALVMYESLKQQLNPHFLFNSLTSLSSLIQTDPKAACRFLDQMSKIYRYILKSRDTETVPLGEEIKLAQLYIQLQKTRFPNGLLVNINVDDENYHRKIVPVTLQNLIENSIKHNIIDIDTPLIIDICADNGYIIVRNNLQKKNFVETSNKQGLANMQSLYRYLSNQPMTITENEHFFTVKFPLI